MTEAELAELACEVWKQIRERPYSVRVAVYVTPAGIEFCKIGGPSERRHTTQWGEGLVGIYDRSVRLDWMIDDVLSVARDCGYLSEPEQV